MLSECMYLHRKNRQYQSPVYMVVPRIPVPVEPYNVTTCDKVHKGKYQYRSTLQKVSKNIDRESSGTLWVFCWIVDLNLYPTGFVPGIGSVLTAFIWAAGFGSVPYRTRIKVFHIKILEKISIKPTSSLGPVTYLFFPMIRKITFWQLKILKNLCKKFKDFTNFLVKNAALLSLRTEIQTFLEILDPDPQVCFLRLNLPMFFCSAKR